MVDSAHDKPEPTRERDDSGGEHEAEEKTGRAFMPGRRASSGEGPDVYLNVPLLKVEEISLEVENLEAHVSLLAQVLDLLKLNVGADVLLGKLKLEIKGVEAQALLEVQLDNVAVIVDRVLTTLDRNPEILQHISRGVESAARSIGGGTGEAVGELGKGARGAVEDVGKGAGGAVESVGAGAGGAVQDVGKGAARAVEDVGEGAGGAVQDVGRGAGEAVRDVGEGTGRAAEEAAEGIGTGAEEAGKGVGDSVENVGKGTGQATERTGKAGEGVGDEHDGGEHDGGHSSQGGTTPEGEHHETEAEPDPGEDGGRDADAGRPANDAAGDEGAGSAEQEEITALQSALRETEESVRDLGRTLLRMLSQHPPSSPRKDE